MGLVEKVSNLGDLKEIGWESVSVKEEMRKNLIARMKSDQVTFDGILGYEETVIPQVQQAILAKHDFILLGLRGQGFLGYILQVTNQSLSELDTFRIGDFVITPGISQRHQHLIPHLIFILRGQLISISELQKCFLVVTALVCECVGMGV